MVPSHTTGPGNTVLVYGEPDHRHRLTVYLDLRCPYCKRMENGLGTVMTEAADQGRLTLHYHFATIIDEGAGGSGSLTALSALGAAADEGQQRFAHYLRVLFAEQPSEEVDAFADTGTLLRLAGEVEGLRGPEFDQKLREGTYTPWAREVSAAFEAGGVQGTPTVLLDGTPLPVLSPMGYAVSPEAFLAELPRA
ncbi:DsbA family protein [Streptomyces sp. NPDC058374]|uniref:DsbA family protein n=1 Tax=unclassified Streptomyces TaxID=2593676 RepID=UPI0036489EB6